MTSSLDGLALQMGLQPSELAEFRRLAACECAMCRLLFQWENEDRISGEKPELSTVWLEFPYGVN